MSDDNAIRPLTDVEKQSMVEITAKGSRDILDGFMAKIAAMRQKFLKEYKPFDNYSARLDFEQHVKSYIEDLSNSLDSKSIKKIDSFDLERYGDAKRFELIDIQEVVEPKLAGSLVTKVDVLTGKNFEFKAKARGNRITVFVPMTDCTKVEEYVNKTYKKEVAKIAN